MALVPTIGWLTRRLARSCGVEVVHSSNDPVQAALLAARETLRVTDLSAWQTDHLLAHVAAEAHLRNLLRRYAINVVVDVGANEGQFAASLRRLGYAGRIVSFEPQSGPVAVLQQRAAGDPQWEVHAFGLGETAADLPLTLYEDHSLSSLHPVNRDGQTRFPDYFAPRGRECIAICRLDDLAPQLGLVVPGIRLLIKTDTQGHDLAVLQGARETLKHASVAVSEGSVKPIYEGIPSSGDIIAYLAALGFSLSGLYPIAHGDRDLSLIELDCFFVRPEALPPAGIADC